MLQKFEKVGDYDKALKALEHSVIERYTKYCKISDKTDPLKSFHSILGSYADRYTHIKTNEFKSASEYRDAWFQGLIKDNNSERKKLFKDEILRNYAVLFLERSYLRNIHKYSRLPLKDYDREIYLGKNDACIGIFVSPTNNNDKWESYKLKGFSAKYEFLTLKQLMYEGYLKGVIINDRFKAEHIHVTKFSDIVAFYDFFKHFSKSVFENIFIDCYINYLKQQNNWIEIPLLLPEFRWGNQKTYHTYRMDFLIINYYTGERLAIELSPYGTHMDLNTRNNKEQWVYENKKRNDYFLNYRVPTVTFTDYDLKNVQDCFDLIKGAFVMKSRAEKSSFKELIKQL